MCHRYTFLVTPRAFVLLTDQFYLLGNLYESLPFIKMSKKKNLLFTSAGYLL